jgi:hypothetical protein
MQKWAVLLVLAGVALPTEAQSAVLAEPVTVEQLEQKIANTHSRWNWRLAKQISDLKLTERLSAPRLARLEAEVHGSKAKQALIAIADESAFLDPPASEVLSRPAPTPAEQQVMLRLSAKAVEKTMASWPNFIANREIIRFEGTATVIPDQLEDELFVGGSKRAPPGANWECPSEPKIGHERLSVIDSSSVTVVNRNGQELHALGEQGGEFECPEGGVSTSEVFGKVLSWVLKIVAHAQLKWSHWEQGPTGLVAVYQYSTLVTHRSDPVEIHGEISINPVSGSMLRLTEMRRWTKHERASSSRAAYDRIVEYDSAVEYGQVNIGSNAVLCPIKRVAIYLTPILWPQGVDAQADQIYRRFGLRESPLQEFLNDVTLTHYRVYGPS